MGKAEVKGGRGEGGEGAEKTSAPIKAKTSMILLSATFPKKLWDPCQKKEPMARWMYCEGGRQWRFDDGDGGGRTRGVKKHGKTRTD